MRRAPEAPTRPAWYWPVGAGLAFAALCALAPRGAYVFGPSTALLLGGLGAWRASRAGGGTLGRDAAAGALVGAGVLIGTVVGFTLAGYLLGSDPAVQEFVRAGEPNPEARLPHRWVPYFGASLGAFGGFALGLGGLAFSAVAGWIFGVAAGHGGAGVGRTVG
jgi:hypothetical protein